MTRLQVPNTPAELTPRWLTAALAETGVVRDAAVSSAEWERVGQGYGFTGLVGRLHLHYDRAADVAPASIIAKLPMAESDDRSGYRARQDREPALAQRYYSRCLREERFYRVIGARFAPRLYYSAADETLRRVVLLLEDLSDGCQGDVLDGCSIEAAAAVIEELAPFHARWWGERVPIRAFPPERSDPKAREQQYNSQVSIFLDRYGDRLSAQVRSIVERLRSRLADNAMKLSDGPHTLTHGDLHLDNLLFHVRSRAVTVLDWQTVSVGPPTRDLALFLFTSLSPDDRRAAEDTLLDRYTALLVEHSVRGHTVESVRLDLRRALLALLAGTIIGIANLDPSDLSERERALQDATIENGRLTTALLDHDVSGLL